MIQFIIINQQLNYYLRQNIISIIELLPIKKFTIAGYREDCVYESLRITAGEMRDIERGRQSKDPKSHNPKDYETNYDAYIRIRKQREAQET